MNDVILRKQVKMIKALQNVSYREIASYIEIKDASFYNWLQGQYSLSEERQRRL